MAGGKAKGEAEMERKVIVAVLLVLATSLLAEEKYSMILATDMRSAILKLNKDNARSCDDRNWPATDSACVDLAASVGLLMLREAKNVDSPPKGAASND
jgi:hypothetical protein